MRKFKKVAAVLLTAAMTLSTGVLAFADQSTTIHFQNAKNWTNVGLHIGQGINFNTLCAPADKCFVTSTDDTGKTKIIWPGGKMEAEGGGWYKLTVTFTDSIMTDGMSIIFNNGVGDVTANSFGFDERDAQAVIASGIPNVNNATKDQSDSVIISKKALAKLGTSLPSDMYFEFNGTKVTTPTTNDAPASYTSAVGGGAADTPAAGDNGSGSGDGSAITGETNADGSAVATDDGTAAGSASGSTTKKTNSKAPSTGDSVAMTVVLFGIVSAVAFVAAKKKVNA